MSLEDWRVELEARKQGRGLKSSAMYITAMKSFLDHERIDLEDFRLDPAGFLQDFLLSHKKGVGRYVKAVKNYCDFAQLHLPKSLTQIQVTQSYSQLYLGDAQYKQLRDAIKRKTLTTQVIAFFILDSAARISAVPGFFAEKKRDLNRLDVYEVKNEKSHVALASQELKDAFAQLKGEMPGSKSSIRTAKIELLDVYRQLGITEKYFFSHPFHVLRHISIQHYLRKTNWNYAAVAEITGVGADVLRESYGRMGAEEALEAIEKV